MLLSYFRWGMVHGCRCDAGGRQVTALSTKQIDYCGSLFLFTYHAILLIVFHHDRPIYSRYAPVSTLWILNSIGRGGFRFRGLEGPPQPNPRWGTLFRQRLAVRKGIRGSPGTPSYTPPIFGAPNKPPPSFPFPPFCLMGTVLCPARHVKGRSGIDSM